MCHFDDLENCKNTVSSAPCPYQYLTFCYGLHRIQVAPSTLVVHVWPPEPVEGVPEPPASEPAAAMLPNQHFRVLPPGNAMLLPSDRKVDAGKFRIPIPSTFPLQCFSPPITSSTQVTAHVVIRTQDVARLPPDAAAVTESAAVQNQSANNHYLQLQPFQCNLLHPGGRAPSLTKLARNLHPFQSWRINKLEAVSAAHAVPA